MLAEIITIGDEILIGQIVDTNSAWIAQQLNAIGIRVKQISSVSVTAGPMAGGKQPSGQKMLYAYIGDANHP